jgi:hypothetical protein
VLLKLVARMKPTGRANARPMINSAQSGILSMSKTPDFASASSGLRIYGSYAFFALATTPLPA